MASVISSKHGFNTRSAGTSSGFALIVVDEVLVHWADEIVFANEENRSEFLAEGLSLDGKRWQVLNLPDNYGYMDSVLIGLISQRYKPKGE